MIRHNSVLTDAARLADAWVTLDPSPVLVTDASLARHFATLVTQHTTVEPPNNAGDGRRIIWRFEMDVVGGWAVTFNPAGFVTRGGGADVVDSTAGAVTYVEAFSVDGAGPWELRGVPDLSSLYDAAGAAAGVLVTAEAYADVGDALRLLKSANLSDLANAATARANLGVAIGTNVEAWNARLDSIAALANASGALTNDGAGGFSYVLYLTSAAAAAAYAPITHGSTHRPGGSDPIYSSQVYAVTGDATNRTFNPSTVSLSELANVVATMLRDKAANLEPST